MIGDITIDALRVGLNGLNLRREASADAVANMETPGYKANRVAFEDQLSNALERGDLSSVRPSVTRSTAAALPNGNNVQIDQELMGLSDTELRQQLLVEAVNTRDIPGFLLSRTADVLDVLDRAAVDNVFVQHDVYHMQIMEGDLAPTIELILPRVAHIQIADTPGRHEPGTGEINYGFLLPFLDQIGYDGWVGCEYKPAGRTRAGLGWAARYLT